MRVDLGIGQHVGQLAHVGLAKQLQPDVVNDEACEWGKIDRNRMAAGPSTRSSVPAGRSASVTRRGRC